jgi:DNA repair photolyase
MKDQPVKGRGAVSSPTGRFARTTLETDPEAGAAPRRPETVLRAMEARSIISTNKSPDIQFDHSINPYQGCEHGCVYCYARPSHSYLDLSPGLDFETQIFYKSNAVARLIEQWEKPSYQCNPIAIGANTDPYQPAEKSLEITRDLLKAFVEYRHPVCLITKGGLMMRDLDLLEELANMNLVTVAVSIPTLDPALKRLLEPRVPDARVRLNLMSALSDIGVPVSLLLAPVIPAVNDAEIESIIEQVAKHGARRASWILLRLPHELKEIFPAWLDVHMPERAGHVMSLVRQSSGGRDYDHRFGRRQRGQGPYARMIGDRFRAACRKHGLNSGPGRNSLDCSLFRQPGQRQMALALE